MPSPHEQKGSGSPFPFQAHMLPLLSLQGSPEAGSIHHTGVKQGGKKKLSAKLEDYIIQGSDT